MAKSILEDLANYVPTKDKHNIIEEKVKNAIASVNHVINLIEDSFDKEESDELNRRLILAIKGNDPSKFTRKIREYKREAKNDE